MKEKVHIHSTMEIFMRESLKMASVMDMERSSTMMALNTLVRVVLCCVVLCCVTAHTCREINVSMAV